jgi:hypothetical protein
LALTDETNSNQPPICPLICCASAVLTIMIRTCKNNQTKPAVCTSDRIIVCSVEEPPKHGRQFWHTLKQVFEIKDWHGTVWIWSCPNFKHHIFPWDEMPEFWHS